MDGSSSKAENVTDIPKKPKDINIIIIIFISFGFLYFVSKNYRFNFTKHNKHPNS